MSVACYRMRSFKPYMSLNTLKILYFSHFNSIINYGLPVWSNIPHSIKIFRMQDYQLFSDLLSPFSFFPAISFSALPSLLRYFASYPSLPRFSTERLHPPPNFSVTVMLIVLIPFLFQFFLYSSQHYYVPSSPGSARYHGVTTDYDIYTLLFFISCCYLLPSVGRLAQSVL